jgi:hypothetical protein
LIEISYNWVLHENSAYHFKPDYQNRRMSLIIVMSSNPAIAGSAMARKYGEGAMALWAEASYFLEFWLPFFQEKGRRKKNGK